MKKIANAKKKVRKRFFVESIILALIIGSPFIFKLHEYIPPEDQFTLLGIEISKNQFMDVSIYVWFLLGKIIPLYLFTIWFFTCKHWWYHIILIPLCMYAFQIFEVLYSQHEYLDVRNVLWLLPVCMVVIPFVYFIRIKLFDKYVHGIDLEAMNAELQYYKSKEKDELKKAGIFTHESITPESVEKDLSDETPKRTINQLIQSIQTSFKTLF